MPAMPKIQAKKVFSVKSKDEGETLIENRGFGDKEPEVRMMNLMMVEGSGYEGMDMTNMSQADMKTEGMKSANTQSTHSGHAMAIRAQEPDIAIELTKFPPTPKVGANFYEFTLAPKTKATAEVYMTSMDMGTETVNSQPDGKGNFSATADLGMSGNWRLRVQIRAPDLKLHEATIKMLTPF